ncbi:MAG: aminotransferase class I/II-fold pyridoxal phosphate-dependent enzyme [Rhizobiaceae bacterium]|nr:aminotransferase class I/II-fold pyridoxal phosphate-dependent enzyme [Rhizobiaceae bacterium]
MSAFALADLGGHDRVTLAQNESAFPPSPLAIAAGCAAAARSHLYPDPDWTLLRDALARAYSVDRDLILCGNGSMDLIACTIRAFAHAGSEVLATDYAYNFSAAATAQAGAVFVKAREADFIVSVDAMLGAVTPATRVAFVCNPGNPTGTRIANSEIVRLRAGLHPDILLVVDQAYGEFDDQDPRPIFDLVARGDTVVLRTLSKAYGLAGARVGWGLFPPAIAAEVRKMQNSNGVTTVSLAMAVAAVDDQGYMRRIVSQTAAIRDRFAAGLRQAGLEVIPGSTNFLLVRLSDPEAARATERSLREAGVIVRGVGGYGLADCLRITIGPEEVMSRVLGLLVGSFAA